MAAHARSHRDIGRFIKIGMTKSGLFRPEEHIFNMSTGRYFRGSDARLVRIVVPKVSQAFDGMINCRHCKSYSLDYCPRGSMLHKAKRIAKLRRHELKYCPESPKI